MYPVFAISVVMGLFMGIIEGGIFSLGMFTICLVILLPLYSWLFLIMDTKKDNVKVIFVKCLLTTVASAIDFGNLYLIYQYI